MFHKWFHAIPLGIGGFCFGRSAEEMFSDAPAWVWFVVGVAVLIVSYGGLASYKHLYLPWQQKGGPQVVWEWLSKRVWKLATIALGITVIAFVSGQPITNWLESEQKAQEALKERIRTRPICVSNCANFDWIVKKCESEAVEAGGLIGPPVIDVEAATHYFRGCLTDKGMFWESCKKGEPDCRLLHYIGPKALGTLLPSFVE